MIKVLALDIYGTVLATNDAENELPPRKGIERLFAKCKEQDIKIVTSSDANIENLKVDLRASFGKHNLAHLIDQIDNYCLCAQPITKNFTPILKNYNISPWELLVIGDREKDTCGARDVGARWIKVPEYYDYEDIDSFDLGKINF